LDEYRGQEVGVNAFLSVPCRGFGSADNGGVTRRPDTLLLGLIGADIEASRSPAMHEREGAAHGLRCIYQLVDLTRLGLTCDALPELLTAAGRLGFAGLNVTHPCKQAVLPLLSELSDQARAIGSVNTIVFDGDRRVGHNTDWYGFKQSFIEHIPGAPLGRVVQLGAGGAGAATGYAVLELGAHELVIVDTIHDRARSLAKRLATMFSTPVYAADDPSVALDGADGLIHATPTGMSRHPGLAVPASLLRADLWVAEVVYFPLETELLRVAKRIGCRTVDGSGMAVFQAVEAFRLFTGLQANPSRMRASFESFDVRPGPDR
jgi:shikimate dehydrogenase